MICDSFLTQKMSFSLSISRQRIQPQARLVSRGIDNKFENQLQTYMGLWISIPCQTADRPRKNNQLS